jgi:hypothetical protein
MPPGHGDAQSEGRIGIRAIVSGEGGAYRREYNERVKIASGLFALLLACAPLRGEYLVSMRGGVSYHSLKNPASKNGTYVFTATDGTLLSVRKADVTSIRLVPTPKPEMAPEDLGRTSSLAGAAKHQRETTHKIHEKPKTMPQKNDAYRPGVGVPLMPGTNDYLVGKTWAPPAGSAVYTGDAPKGVSSGDTPTGAPSGDAPTGVMSGDAPKGEPPPPPPPPIP